MQGWLKIAGAIALMIGVSAGYSQQGRYTLEELTALSRVLEQERQSACDEFEHDILDTWGQAVQACLEVVKHRRDRKKAEKHVTDIMAILVKAGFKIFGGHEVAEQEQPAKKARRLPGTRGQRKAYSA